MIIERQVLDTLYKKYSNQIYHYIYSLCKDNLLAQDLMQDTFFKALISMEGSDEDILHWLYKVARNLYIDQWRKRKRYIVQGIENIDIYNEDDVIDKLLVEEQKMILYKAILKLSTKEKEVVELYYFSELNQQDISNQLGMSLGNIRVTLHRSKLKLKKIITDHKDL